MRRHSRQTNRLAWANLKQFVKIVFFSETYSISTVPHKSQSKARHQKWESSSRPAFGPAAPGRRRSCVRHRPPRAPLAMISLHQTRVRHAGAEVCNLLALFDTPEGWTEHCPAWASPLYVCPRAPPSLAWHCSDASLCAPPSSTPESHPPTATPMSPCFPLVSLCVVCVSLHHRPEQRPRI